MVATTYTGTSIELASPDTSRAVIALLVSMPSVRTTIALCVPGGRQGAAPWRRSRHRATSCRRARNRPARGQLAQLAGEILALVERRVEREDRHFVLALPELDNSEAYACRAIAILGPSRMLPLMSTRIATLSGDW